MNVENFRLVLEYHYWANYKILVNAERLPTEQFTASISATPNAASTFPWGSLRDTMVHMLNSERGWLSLCRDGVVLYERDELPPTDFRTVAALKAVWDGIEYDWHVYGRSLTDANLQDIIAYEVDGNLRTRRLWHCLWHVINHGTQHRSECAALLTHFGHSPGNYDLTLFTLARGV